MARMRAFLRGAAGLMLAAMLAPVPAVMAEAGGGKPESQRTPAEVSPYLVERSFDTRRRLEALLGEAWQGCMPWRIETFVRPDGRLVFQINDPADQKAIVDWKYDSQSLEFVLGDAQCNYRLRIERNK
ncbi:MAG: hypothetical protein EPO23_00465 [Xanthobacteraceae bacterium]|nr:MAG: hypothetical protein EPO23_00465 [Xanthobacteraceae bacterium]